MIEIYRWYHEDCVIGRLKYKNFQCFTLELPDRDNVRNISCIPEAIYNWKKKESLALGEILHLQHVPERDYIYIHAGNYTRQIEGCILVGDSVKFLDRDKIPDVTNSKNTLRKLLGILPENGKVRIT